MSSLTDSIDEPVAEETAPAAPAEEGATFRGDTGGLPIDTRRVLVQLLLGPSVDAWRQSKLWPVLLRDESIIRSRMHDLFLEVVIDHEQRVAFTRQVVSEDLDVPILLRKASLTFLETALLLFLRQRLTQADAQGDRAVVSLEEMLEHLSVFERDNNPDHAKFERQIVNAVDKAKKLSLLQFIRGSGERYEVSPTLKLLFSAEEIQDLTRTYATLACAPAAAADVDDESDALSDSAEDEEEAL
ncbi:DUF4194 domain-containing protein [Acidovorax sp. NCPPB 3859]|nr:MULTISPECIES: DUF4194 domain-containing protein [unclassified Acidovorax]MDA8448215.1 DUF4194 domain-containing protein [Acidovorax sp. GBBC 3297]MDA8457818.1 DUF4194 domain-containing protein [Acidovorax sp. GBBC 3333]MDA8462658.1 DUF4194 domain-containing protein [Acidovorax sp. GBBC 3332]MDA8467888.1 DUF4194 domain-containing protein [Acidovorax sp. GBBC 3299]WCM77902.1 DUF4194 domain-containing protein [Acidovorax sp. GBBC 712]